MSGRRPLLVHLAVDANTPQRPRTTSAIEWLVDELDDMDNVLIAYRRTVKRGQQEQRCGGTRYPVYDFPFFGLPLGIGLHGAMKTAARRTIALLERDGIRPDLIHAHKLTFEGLAGWYVARHFGVPLFVSLRGEVETKVLRVKPLLRPFVRRICADAVRIYHVSPWYRAEFHHYVPGQAAKERLLPNIVRNIASEIRPQPAGDRFVSILNLDTWRRKGLRWLLDGFARALRVQPGLRLDIIGGGRPESAALVTKMIATRGLVDRVTLVGRLPNDELLARLPTYRALLLPSVNETFGMVYVEALFAGVPVMFTRGTAIDGYLDGLDVARPVPARNVTAVAEAILELDREAETLRANIAASAAQLFETFDPATTVARYRADVRAALAQPQR